MDPFTGILNPEDAQTARDFLGRDIQISERGQASLPVGGAPVTGGGGPVAPGGTGVSPVASSTGGGGGPTKAPGMSDAAKAALAAKFGLKAADVARKFLPGDSTAARNPETEQAYQTQRSGERADLSGAGAAAGGFQIPPDALSGVSGGGAFTGDPANQVPFQIPPDVLTGASGGGAAGGASAGLGAGADAASAAAESSALAGGAAGGAGSSLGPALGLGLGAAATGLNIFNRAQGGMSAGQQAGEAAIDTAGLALAPFTGGVSAMVAPLVNMAIENIATIGDQYASTRKTAYGKLAQGLQGGFAPSLQEAASKGPEAVEALLTPEKMKEWGLEASRDPQTGEYLVGLSSVGHPYIKQRDAIQAQTQLSQAVNQALQLSRAAQLMRPTSDGATAPAPEPTPAKPPTTPAGGGPLGLAEIGLEVER